MKPKYFKNLNGEAYIRNFKLEDLANKYETPLFVIDQKELVETMAMYKESFKSDDFNTHIVYASKAMLLPHLCKLCKENNLWMDAVSLGDLYVMYKSGFKMENVMFHGNNKSNEELAFASLNGCTIVVDNIEELTRLIRIAEETKVDVSTMFRVNPGIDAHTHKYIQTATFTSKFGESIFDDDQIEKIMSLYKSTSRVKLLGFHSHIGSQIQEVDAFLKNVEKMMEFSSKVMNKYQYPLTALNLGGGFGIPYTRKDNPLNKEAALKEMINKIKEVSKSTGFIPLDVYIEPGRSILGNSCVTLYTCGYLKKTYGKKNYQFVDGGMTDNIRPALYQAEYEVDICNKLDNEKNIMVDVAGKCCESGDIVCYDTMIPETNVGDIMVVYATGAYTYSMSSNYNNMIKPAVVFLDDDEILAARRQELDDLLYLFELDK